MNELFKGILKGLTSNPKIWKALGEAIIAAITAFITALTTTSCMGRGPLW